MGWQPREHIPQIGERIVAIEFGRLDQASLCPLTTHSKATTTAAMNGAKDDEPESAATKFTLFELANESIRRYLGERNSVADQTKRGMGKSQRKQHFPEIFSL